MKNLLFVILSFLLFACTDEYILNANLSIVEDEVDGYTKEISKVDDNNFKVVNTQANETTEYRKN